jgi:hypothetical protein
MNRQITTVLCLLVLISCGKNGGGDIQTRDFPTIDPSVKYHIYLQNHKGVEKNVKIFLDQKCIFEGSVPAAPYMPPVVKALPVKDLSIFNKVSVVLGDQKHSQDLNNSTVEILINFDFPKMLIQQYDQKIGFK